MASRPSLRVAIWERNPVTCACAAETVGGLGIVTDVRESGDVDAALARTIAELGPDALAPDFTLTEGLTAMSTPDALERGGHMVPMGRAATSTKWQAQQCFWHPCRPT